MIKALKQMKEISQEYFKSFKMRGKNEFAKSIILCDYRKKDNVHLGLFKLQKCFTTVRRKQFITIMP